MHRMQRTLLGFLFGALLVFGARFAYDQAAHQHAQEAKEKPKGPVRVTMEALHASGGVPPGWKFTVPEGDPEAGREVFVKMKCYTCHNVSGEKFPAHKRDVGDVGPDLTGMGEHHPAEYLAESILNVNAVILTDDPKYTGPDKLSVMPEYLDTLTLRQWVDLVAYLKSLAPKAEIYVGEGEVRKINLEGRFLVVKHGEITGFMGPMTMSYSVDPADLLKGLKPGDKIKFKIDANKRAIVEIERIK